MTDTLDDMIACLPAETAEAETRYARFFREFRKAELPFLPCRAELDPAALHTGLIDSLMAVGGFGIAEGVGAAMHLYMLAAVAKMPIGEPALAAQRAALIGMIDRDRLLLATTGSDSRHRSANAAQSATVAVPVEGGYRINGTKTFLSLAEVADLVLFTADIAGCGLSFFIAPLKQPAIRIGPPHFDAAFPLHTHSVTLDNLVVPAAMALAATEGGGANAAAHAFQRALFQSLISAVYLGAARRALLEAARFAKEEGLAELDGVQAELGRLVIRLHGAIAASRVCGGPLARFIAGPSAETLGLFGEAAAVAKQTGCTAAVEIVAAAQRFIGTRAMEPGHVMAEISRLAQFAPLHPVVGAQAERQFGQALLRGGR